MQTPDAVVLCLDAAYSDWRDAGGGGSKCRRPDKIEGSSVLMRAPYRSDQNWAPYIYVCGARQGWDGTSPGC